MSLDVSTPRDERRLQLEVWNDTARPYPRELAAHVLFERAAHQRPDDVAVRAGGRGGVVDVSYAELNARANRLAHHLRRHGAGRGDIVAVRMPASVDMVVAVLAVLKAGAAYLPLDPGLPRERQRFVLDDASVAIVLTSADPDGDPDGDRPPGDEAAGRHVLDVDRARSAIEAEPATPLSLAVTGDDLAYVIYTSGSTGDPKGVLVPHRGIVRLVTGLTHVDLDDSVRFLQLAPLSFDASVLELFAPLLHGGTVVLPDPELNFVDRFLDAVARHAPDTAVLVSPQLHLLIDHHLDALAALGQVLFGGDVASVEHLRRAHAAIGRTTRLIHVYGPTECAVVATTSLVDHVPERGSLSIGRPIGNTQAYVLDDLQRLVPIGDEGELCLGGDGLAVGYLDRPDLTSRAFVAHPFSDEPGARLYRTGDRCRLLPDGAIEFLGRRDDQVKIRGHRVELGEVQAVLERHPDVLQCVVVAREVSRDRALIAYVVPWTADLSVADLRGHMQRSVAAHACPSAYVLLDHLPMTRNGKVDRAALPAPEQAHAGVAEPLSAAQRQVASAFCAVLEVEAVGFDDDFAELGGTSLMFVDLHARIDNADPGRLALADVFAAGTVRRIAEMLCAPPGAVAS